MANDKDKDKKPSLDYMSLEKQFKTVKLMMDKFVRESEKANIKMFEDVLINDQGHIDYSLLDADTYFTKDGKAKKVFVMRKGEKVEITRDKLIQEAVDHLYNQYVSMLKKDHTIDLKNIKDERVAQSIMESVYGINKQDLIKTMKAYGSAYEANKRDIFKEKAKETHKTYQESLVDKVKTSEHVKEAFKHFDKYTHLGKTLNYGALGEQEAKQIVKSLASDKEEIIKSYVNQYSN